MFTQPLKVHAIAKFGLSANARSIRASPLFGLIDNIGEGEPGCAERDRVILPQCNRSPCQPRRLSNVLIGVVYPAASFPLWITSRRHPVRSSEVSIEFNGLKKVGQCFAVSLLREAKKFCKPTHVAIR